MHNFLNKLIKLPRRSKKILLLFFDILIFFISTLLAFYFFYGEYLYFYKVSITYIVFSTIVACICFNFFSLYKTIIRFSGITDIENCFKALVIYFIVMTASIYLHKTTIDINFLFYQTIISFLLFTLYRRLIFKIIKLYKVNNIENILEPILIYGAGEAGRKLLAILKESNKNIVIGFLDDDENLQLRIQNNINIYHPNKINDLIKMYSDLRIIVAMPSISKEHKNKIINKLLEYNIPISTLPSLESIIANHAKPTDIINLKIEDLLGRESIVPDEKLLSKNITNKNILVTGAGGSIGSELSRQIFKLKPKKMILVDNSEFALFNIFNELTSNKLYLKNKIDIVPKMCDVNDEVNVNKIVKSFKLFSVFHTAAYKHVHLVEINNLTGIKNNILGTLNLINACIKSNVKNFVFISTDKAVRPTNLMGATKRFAELILQSLAKENKKIKISIVRFGNVLGSSGSVVPIFREQIRTGGPVTVSHKDIKRYFMTIPEATELVIQASSISQKSGSVFYLDMGEPIKIVKLAKRMINLSGHSIFSETNSITNSIKIIFTGLKPGEKMFEELIIDGESKITDHPRIYSVEENFVEWKTFERVVVQLENEIKNSNTDKAIKILEEYVTGYKIFKKL